MRSRDQQGQHWPYHAYFRIRRLEILFFSQSIILFLAFLYPQIWLNNLSRNFAGCSIDSQSTPHIITNTSADSQMEIMKDHKGLQNSLSTPLSFGKGIDKEQKQLSFLFENRLVQTNSLESIPKQTHQQKKSNKNYKGKNSDLIVYDQYRKNHRNERISRNLQRRPSITSLSQGLFVQGKQHCKTMPILSPINDLSNFTFDERVHKIMLIIQTLSSKDSLNHFTSPQHRAACWILYDDEFQMLPEDKLIVQRYIMTVLIFSVLHNENGLLRLPKNICDTFFVECNTEGLISVIDWRSRLLQGTIPIELSYLKSLEELNLRESSLFGTIPSELTWLSNLNTIVLRDNDFSGALPTEIGSVNNLILFDASFNSLEGSIPSELGELNALAVLHLSDNNMDGSIPWELMNCTQLEDVHLANNNFTGPMSNNIGNLQNLQNVWLYGNNLHGHIPTEIGLLSSLKTVLLYNNKLTGPLPEEVRNLGSLELLWINGNEISGTLPDVFENFENLTELKASNNELSGTFPETLWAENLWSTSIQLHHNKFDGKIPDRVCGNGMVLVDTESWFLDEPRIKCDCCEKSHCHIWNINALDTKAIIPPPIPNAPKVSNASKKSQKRRRLQEQPRKSQNLPKIAPNIYIDLSGKKGRRIQNTNSDDNEKKLNVPRIQPPKCPEKSIQSIAFSFNLEITDAIADITYSESFNDGSGRSDICLSPSGCYSLSYINNEGMQETNFIGNSERSQSLSLRDENTCDAIEVCGTLVDSTHPRRAGLNHLTQLVTPDLSVLKNPKSPEYMALCWIMTEDSIFDEFDICDGALLQRFVMILFYFTYDMSINYDDLKFRSTCEWPGITCASKGKFISDLNLSNKNLEGSLMTEIGLLTRLERVDLSNNKLNGKLDQDIFSNMPHLEVFNVGINAFGGKLPNRVFELSRVKEVNFSSNHFDEWLPSNLKCSKSLESISIQKNVIGGFIENAFASCKNVKHIDLSFNYLKGSIPKELGTLKKLQVLQLNNNLLTGSISEQIFNASLIEIFMLQGNKLTGNIPTQIETLQEAITIALNHNSFKGEIPSKISEIESLRHLYLHSNFFAGMAPIFDTKRRTKDFDYISDCGSPFYLLPEPLECTSCTMCCNSDGDCQLNSPWELSIVVTAFIVVLCSPIALGLMLIALSKLRNWSREIKNDDIVALFNSDSIYFLIFSRNRVAWAVYILTLIFQSSIHLVFLKASNFTFEETDWRFSFKCQANTIECIDENSVSIHGELLFYCATLAFLGADFVKSFQQIWSGAVWGHFTLILSGMGLLYSTALTLFTTAVYNWALAESDTDLIVNAVILLFVNELDESLLSVFMYVFPVWIEKRIQEMEKRITGIQNKGNNRNDPSARIGNSNSQTNPDPSRFGNSFSVIPTNRRHSISTLSQSFPIRRRSSTIMPSRIQFNGV